MEKANDERPAVGRSAFLLGESHRRVLTTMLRRLELAVWQLEEQLKRETPPRLVLTRFTKRPTPRQRDELLDLAARIRQQIGQMAREYGLQAREDILSQTIKAEFSLLWSDLEETRPQKLRNYGEMHPRASEILGPQIQDLIDLVLTLEHAAQ